MKEEYIKISELISILQSKLDEVGDIEVVVDGYESGFDIPKIYQSGRYPTSHHGKTEFWDGQYIECREGDSCLPVLVIGRT